MDLISQASNQEKLGVRKALTNFYSTAEFCLAEGSEKSSRS